MPKFTARFSQSIALILTAIFTVSSSLTGLIGSGKFLINPIKAANNQIGTEKLQNSEYYPGIDLLTSIRVGLFNEQPNITFNLKEPVQGFVLSSPEKNLIDSLFIKITFADDSQSEYLKVAPAPDIHSSDHYISNQFLFLKGVKIIQVFGSDKKEVNLQTFNQLGLLEEKVPSQITATNNVDKQYIKKFNQQLGLDIITRDEWGISSESDWKSLIPSPVTKITVEDTDTAVNETNPVQTIKSIYTNQFYRCNNQTGFFNINNSDCNELSKVQADTNYNYFIDPSGKLYEGRAGGSRVSTTKDNNNNNGNIRIALLGNYSNQKPTQASLETLIKLSAGLSQLYGINLEQGKTFNSDVLTGTLQSLISEINNSKSANQDLQQITEKTNKLVDKADIVNQGGAQLIVDINKVKDSQIKEKLSSISRGILGTKTIRNLMIYQVPQDQIKQIISETLLVAPETSIQPNYVYRTTDWDNSDLNRSIPSDYNLSTHWYLQKIKAPEAWKRTGGCASDNTCGGSPSIKIAVIDTGVAYENFNYDAGGNYQLLPVGVAKFEIPTSDTANGIYNEGYDREYQKEPQLTNTHFDTVNAYDATQKYICDLRSSDNPHPCNALELAKVHHANDDFGHGTFISTLIAGDTADTGVTNKVVGIAHNTTIMPIKVMYPNDRSFCYSDQFGTSDLTCSHSDYDYRTTGDSLIIADGIKWAVDHGANVLNLSIITPVYDSVFKEAVDYALAHNVVVVASAGNTGTDIGSSSPASFPGVITVGASTTSDTRANYSNYGSSLALVAPVGDSGIGSMTYNCYPNKNSCSDETNPNLFKVFSSADTPVQSAGTSFAAPQVAAAAGLLLSIKNTLTPNNISTILKSAATDIGTAGRDDQFGYGILNLEQSIIITQDAVPPDITIGGLTGGVNYAPDYLTGPSSNLPGTLESGFSIQESGRNNDIHPIQFNNTTTSENLASEYFGLYLNSSESTVSASTLKTYYASQPLLSSKLTYLNGVADGLNPLMYINGNTLKLVDGASHFLNEADKDFEFLGTAPLGTYTVTGQIFDLARNETTVNLKIIVVADSVAPVLTVNGLGYSGQYSICNCTHTGSLTGDLGSGFTLQTTGSANDLYKIVANNTYISSSEPLRDDYFAFNLDLGSTTVTSNDLKTYYAAQSSLATKLTYLNGVADGTNPLLYLKGSSFRLIDGATRSLSAPDTDLEFLGNMPVGTYTVTGQVTDTTGNATPLTLKLIVNWTQTQPTPTPTPVPVATDSVYRFWSGAYHHHFYTANIAERDEVIAKYDDNIWLYEGPVYHGSITQAQGMVPLYRFWSGKFRGHFYTANEVEKNEVIAKYDDNTWHFEGIAYYVYPSQVEGTVPVYRFWSGAFHGHFYTANEAEKNEVIAKYSRNVWSFEGPVYYVKP